MEITLFCSENGKE